MEVGQTIGAYRVIAKLGEGGMGEVYRARDVQLGRDVAIKILPAAYAADTDRRVRFEREAMVLASLSHPRIGAVYGVDRHDGAPALILELVEGPTLADRIAQGPLPADEVTSIAMQLVEALEAAHNNGVIHRDLKPANIKIRPDGAIKVLDFGIAKLRASDEGHANAATAAASTDPGIVLGTAAYMSPEQARGEFVDERTDIWAFGAVVFEMTTGRSPFGKNNTAETIVAVLNETPDFDQVPSPLQRVVRSCLQRDLRRRLRHISDVRLLIDETPAVAARARSLWPWLIAAGSVLLAATTVIWSARTPSAPVRQDAVRFQFDPAATPVASGASAISPDGRHFAYMGLGADGAQRMYIRDLDSLVDRPLPGTEVSGAVPPVFWSPDSRSIAYDAGGRLRIVNRDGGLPRTVCDVSDPIVGGTWNRDGAIVFSAIGKGLLRVHESGGTPAPITTLELEQNEGALMPVFLQDGKRFLFLRVFFGNVERNGIFAGALDATAVPKGRILATPTSVAYVPDGPDRGLLLFLRNQDLMAQSLDEARLETVGEPRLLAKGVSSYRDGATVSASTNGVLAYLNAAPLHFVWSDRQGRVVKRSDDRGLYETLTVSPDGTKALVSQAGSLATNASELWLFDFVQETKVRLTEQDAHNAIWSNDGRRIIFSATQSMIEMQPGGSTPPRELFSSRERTFPVSPTSWSADGQFVLFTLVGVSTNADIWLLRPEKPSDARVLVGLPGSEMQAQFSPEPGPPRWVAYTGNGSGREEVFLRGFNDTGAGQLVSPDGGHSPRWRGDGRELFYVNPRGELMAASLPSGASRAGTPEKLFDVPAGFASRDATYVRAGAPWGLTPDGQRFVFAAPAEAGGRRQFTIVLNWNAAAAP